MVTVRPVGDGASSMTVPVLVELSTAEHVTDVLPRPVRYVVFMLGGTLSHALPTGEVGVLGRS
jgi:hypothetical protein